MSQYPAYGDVKGTWFARGPFFYEQDNHSFRITNSVFRLPFRSINRRFFFSEPAYAAAKLNEIPIYAMPSDGCDCNIFSVPEMASEGRGTMAPVIDGSGTGR